MRKIAPEAAVRLAEPDAVQNQSFRRASHKTSALDEVATTCTHSTPVPLGVSLTRQCASGGARWAPPSRVRHRLRRL